MNNSFAYRETFSSPTQDYSMWQTRYDQRAGRLNKAKSLNSSTEPRRSARVNYSNNVPVACPVELLTTKIDPFDPYPDMSAVNKSRWLAKDVGRQIESKLKSRRDSIKSIIEGVRTVLVKDTDNTKNSKKDLESSNENPTNEHDSASGSDEVFKKITSSKTNRATRFTKRRTSSLDAKLNSPSQTHSQSITSHPFDNRQNRCSANSRSNGPSFSPRHQHPNRSSTTITTTNPRRQNSGYDSHDRGRGRDMYRDSRHRGGGSDRENEASLSDRDQRSDRGSFNRSMSNAEGTPDDKIGKIKPINHSI